jgi:hypothetical protein
MTSILRKVEDNLNFSEMDDNLNVFLMEDNICFLLNDGLPSPGTTHSQFVNIQLLNEKITKSRRKLRQSQHFLLVLSTTMLLEYVSKVRLNDGFPPSLYNHIV